MSIEMVDCFRITCAGRSFLLRPDEVPGMRESMDRSEFAGRYEILPASATERDLADDMVRRWLALVQ